MRYRMLPYWWAGCNSGDVFGHVVWFCRCIFLWKKMTIFVSGHYFSPLQCYLLFLFMMSILFHSCVGQGWCALELWALVCSASVCQYKLYVTSCYPTSSILTSVVDSLKQCVWKPCFLIVHTRRRCFWDWIGLCSVLCPRQHSIGYMGDRFYRSKDPTNSIKVLKVHIVHRQIKHTISRHKHKTQQVP